LPTSFTFLEHHLAEDGYDFAVLFDRDPLDHHFLALNQLGLVDFAFPVWATMCMREFFDASVQCRPI